MPNLAFTTELDAVNEMLVSIGQAPVNTLAVSGIRDVNIARGELLKVSRQVQLIGWNWNTDEGYTLTPDIDGHISLPEGLLKFEPMDRSRQLVQRRNPAKGLGLYDKDRLSFEFDEPVKIKAVWGFPFDDLPESARNYVAISAARKFQAQTIGSQALDGFKAEDEQRAWATLLRDERGGRNTNMFRRNRGLQRLYNRSTPTRSYP
ncbi:hypothetical protein [Phenylobacterium sp.]|uniref:hypothetical protein n=1 Tax=Phenylobacterium sp. TaxID=1871053 RepID=UPI00394766FF